MIADFPGTRIATKKRIISINFSVFAHISKNLQMESNTFRPMIMNYTQLTYEATPDKFWKVSEV